MKIALAINLVENDRTENMKRIRQMATEASKAGANIILFGETAITGMINNDCPTHDLPLSDTIPGESTEIMAQLAVELKVWIAIGLLEHDSGKLYDSAVLLSPDGRIVLEYRRIDGRWHGKKANPVVYCEGTDVALTNTDHGTMAIIICGDLWNDSVIQRLQEIKPDMLFHLYARCFDNGSRNQDKWNKEEIPEFSNQVKKAGVKTFSISYLSSSGLPAEGEAMGGAMIFASNGVLQSQYPLGKSGILYFDMAD
jgi:predicted amidohydrolase